MYGILIPRRNLGFLKIFNYSFHITDNLFYIFIYTGWHMSLGVLSAQLFDGEFSIEGILVFEV